MRSSQGLQRSETVRAQWIHGPRHCKNKHCRLHATFCAAEVEETDELLLADPDELAMGCDPEYLPHRQLSDFAFYNSEVRLSSVSASFLYP